MPTNLTVSESDRIMSEKLNEEQPTKDSSKKSSAARHESDEVESTQKTDVPVVDEE